MHHHALSIHDRPIVDICRYASVSSSIYSLCIQNCLQARGETPLHRPLPSFARDFSGPQTFFYTAYCGGQSAKVVVQTHFGNRSTSNGVLGFPSLKNREITGHLPSSIYIMTQQCWGLAPHLQSGARPEHRPTTIAAIFGILTWSNNCLLLAMKNGGQGVLFIKYQ